MSTSETVLTVSIILSEKFTYFEIGLSLNVLTAKIEINFNFC